MELLLVFEERTSSRDRRNFPASIASYQICLVFRKNYLFCILYIIFLKISLKPGSAAVIRTHQQRDLLRVLIDPLMWLNLFKSSLLIRTASYQLIIAGKLIFLRFNDLMVKLLRLFCYNLFDFALSYCWRLLTLSALHQTSCRHVLVHGYWTHLVVDGKQGQMLLILHWIFEFMLFHSWCTRVAIFLTFMHILIYSCPNRGEVVFSYKNKLLDGCLALKVLVALRNTGNLQWTFPLRTPASWGSSLAQNIFPWIVG